MRRERADSAVRAVRGDEQLSDSHAEWPVIDVSILQIPKRVDDPIVAPFPKLLEGHTFGMSIQQGDVCAVVVNRGPAVIERKFGGVGQPSLAASERELWLGCRTWLRRQVDRRLSSDTQPRNLDGSIPDRRKLHAQRKR